MPGLYLHIPFCGQKCRYCAFTSLPRASRAVMDAYCAGLCDELSRRAAQARGIVFDTVFAGGGTPSLLPPRLFCQIVSRARSVFDISDDAEFTCECNPESASPALLRIWRDCGVNRVSIGVQTFDRDGLRLLGRGHTPEQALAAVQAAKDAGFARIGIDLICGVPGQNADTLAATIEAAVALNIGHISCYQLEIEAGTRLFDMVKSGEITPKNDDDSADDMALWQAALRAAGYRRYEVSNFARPGHECRHNQNYWRRGPYLGAGLAAHSFLGGKRFYNTSDMGAYLRGAYEGGVCDVDEREALEETVMLSLRTEEGLCQSALTDAMTARALSLCQSGMLTYENDRFSATPRGFEVLNRLILHILDG